MVSLNQIYNDMYEVGTILIAEYKSLPDGVDALVIANQNGYGVFYDLNQIDTLAKERAVAAHEWAHIVTGATYTLGATPAVIQAAERKATRKQIKRLLPFEEMKTAVRQGYTEPYQLADLFCVPEDLVVEALEYCLGPCGLNFSRDG